MIIERPLPKIFRPLEDAARYKGIWGGRGCCHPDTPIDTPNGSVKISEFKGGQVFSQHKGAIYNAIASAAIPYTEEQLFNVSLRDGRTISVTDEHRFLTQRGWVYCADLTTNDALAVSQRRGALNPHKTNPVLGLSKSQRGVQHCSETHAGYRDGCSAYHHQYDRLLQSAVNSGLFSALLRVGEWLRNFHALMRADVPGCGSIDSLLLLSSPLSNQDAVRVAAEQSSVVQGSYSGDKISEWLSAFCQQLQQFHGKNTHFWPYQELCSLFRCFFDNLKNPAQSQRKGHCTPIYGVHDNPSLFSLSCRHEPLSLVEVQSVCKGDRLTYWDLHVPYFENYLSNGIVNHNSGKSHNRAEALVEDALAIKGMRAVCIREVQKTLKESAKRLIEDKLQEYGLGQRHGFKVFNEVIQTPGDGVIMFQGMQDHSAESIKSLEGFHRAWVEEAQTLSSRSLQLLRPTIRSEDSEIWFTWNPRRKSDPVDSMFRGGTPPTNAVLVKANWNDNPFFPKVLEQERRDCLMANPDEYEHIWEGGYATFNQGAYYAKNIAAARAEDRIGIVPVDPLMKFHMFFDIGGTGAKADAFVIWVAQVIGKEIRVVNYYEVCGQPIQAHLEWMRKEGYEPHKCQLWLPHDGATNDKVFSVSYQSAFESAGYSVDVVPNQGKGAAMLRIEAGRRWFGSCFFDKEKTESGLEALGAYHEKRDENRQIGLGPEHDWASHGADGFGLMCVVVESLFTKPKQETRRRISSGGWMS